MIIATAGHVDHGKTTLVRALTGVDTDRLAEEKRRGLTIDLGFAYTDLGGETLGFVDVPGHERFVHNMLAGVSGIAGALLVVAADDGVMPQTREHLAILDLLGVPRGVVALTKIDRVPASRIAEVIASLEAVLSDTCLADAPILPISASTGDGLAALRAELEHAARQPRQEAEADGFRLAIDRSFTLTGAGVVVTGTVVAGHVTAGDTLTLSPAGATVRVRRLHADNTAADTAEAGQRCGLNLAAPGLRADQVHRGDWLVAPALHAPTTRLDAELRLLRDVRPVTRDLPVHLHLGAADEPARVVLLDTRSLAPGATGLVQLVPREPIVALYGDRFILRDQSAQRTIGGGRIVDPFAPARGRGRPDRLAALRALARPKPTEALAALLRQSPTGIDLTQFLRARNLPASALEPLCRRHKMITLRQGKAHWAIAPEHLHALREAIVAGLGSWHAQTPNDPGPSGEALRRSLQCPTAPVPLDAAVRELLTSQRIKSDGMHLRLPGHRPTLSAADTALWRQVRPVLAERALKPPGIHDVAASIGTEPETVRRVLSRAAGLGLAWRIATNRFFLPHAVLRLGQIVETLAQEAPDGAVTAAAYRDRSGIGRNLTVQLLEFFDRLGLTVRIGDAHVLRTSAARIFDGTRCEAD